MQECDRIAEVRQAVREARSAGRSVGFVPTMGYLHRGHMALVAKARAECGFVVASVFVNPLQFAPNEDFEQYPRDPARDRALLEQAGVDLLFAPSVMEMYPRPVATQVSVPALSRTLEGKTRPTHFQGVATVVLKLFQIVQPDRAYFGQKDGQQVAVLRRMVSDLSVPIELCVVPTVREPDGLALSSRNTYLGPEDRQAALQLHQALRKGEGLVRSGGCSPDGVRDAMLATLRESPRVRPDYAEVVDPETMAPAAALSGRIMLAVAAYVGPTRLIDNVIIEG